MPTKRDTSAVLRAHLELALGEVYKNVPERFLKLAAPLLEIQEHMASLRKKEYHPIESQIRSLQALYASLDSASAEAKNTFNKIGELDRKIDWLEANRMMPLFLEYRSKKLVLIDQLTQENVDPIVIENHRKQLRDLDQYLASLQTGGLKP
jgi:hypothetical protein